MFVSRLPEGPSRVQARIEMWWQDLNGWMAVESWNVCGQRIIISLNYQQHRRWSFWQQYHSFRRQHHQLICESQRVIIFFHHLLLNYCVVGSAAVASIFPSLNHLHSFICICVILSVCASLILTSLIYIYLNAINIFLIIIIADVFHAVVVATSLHWFTRALAQSHMVLLMAQFIFPNSFVTAAIVLCHHHESQLTFKLDTSFRDGRPSVRRDVSYRLARSCSNSLNVAI